MLPLLLIMPMLMPIIDISMMTPLVVILMIVLRLMSPRLY